MGKFYISTPIYYASGNPHIGHAYTSILCDFVSRYKRMKGEEVFFTTGMDEHGQKIMNIAKHVGVTPQVFVDKIAKEYIELLEMLKITNTDFLRTTEDRHKKVVSEFWRMCLAKGDIYKKKYTGLYCEGCESFKLEKDLVDGKCPDHLRVPQEIEEENYFFKLSTYQEKLLQLFDNNKSFVYPSDKYNEMYNIIKGGLEDISISRHFSNLSWGIPVPDDSEQVVYVWFDALTFYLTSVGFLSNESEFKKWWPADVHMVGKEINRFHSILWPAMLMSAGIEVPNKVVVHGWITVEGQKMSKTIGNVIDARDIVKEHGLDVFRYYVGRELAISRDGDFSTSRFIERYNSDLAHGLGNFVFRVLSMVNKYLDGVVPAMEPSDIEKEWKEYSNHFENYEFSLALDVAWRVISKADAFINNEKPWELAKTDKNRLNDVLYYLLEICYQVSWMIYPFMPDTSDSILRQLGLDVSKERKKDFLNIKIWDDLSPGLKISKGEPMFPVKEIIK